jgi:hypothetical protein
MDDGFPVWPAYVFGYLAWTWINSAIARAKNLDVVNVVVVSILASPFLGYLYAHAVPVRERPPY